MLQETLPKEPNYTDRSAPLFPAADLDYIHNTRYGTTFFEYRSAGSYFVSDTSGWSGVFTLGEGKSDEVMEHIKVFARTTRMEEREEARRGTVYFK
jgi:hypothetical protein